MKSATPLSRFACAQRGSKPLRLRSRWRLCRLTDAAYSLRVLPSRLAALTGLRSVCSAARLSPLLTTAHRFCAVTLRLFATRSLLTASRKMPFRLPASPVFSSARFAVPLLPAAQRFLLVSRETFIRGPILLHAHPRCPARSDSAPRRWEGQSLHRRRSGSCPVRHRSPTDCRTR